MCDEALVYSVLCRFTSCTKSEASVQNHKVVYDVVASTIKRKGVGVGNEAIIVSGSPHCTGLLVFNVQYYNMFPIKE